MNGFRSSSDALSNRIRLSGEGFYLHRQSRFSAGCGVAVHHAFDDSLVNDGLSLVEAGCRKLCIAGGNAFKNTLDSSLAAALPETVVKPISLRSTDTLDSGLLVGHFWFTSSSQNI